MSLINILNLTFAYEGSYDNIFENVSFQIDTNWRLGFIGRNGRGKTTFLQLLTNKYTYSGSICASVEFEYFPFYIENTAQNTIDVISDLYKDYELWKLERELQLLKLTDDVLYRPFCTLSKGEQTKIMLALLFIKENSFLLIDEPTDHLDITGRKIVSSYLKGKKGFILVSHDRAFLDDCIDHVLAINKANITVQKGNFSTWHTSKQMEDNLELATNEKLKKDIKRLKTSAMRTANWSNNAEKTKYDTKNAGLKPDRGYVGHKAAKLMKRSKNIEDKQLKAVEEKSKLLKNIEDADTLKLSMLKYHSKRLVLADNISIFYDDKIVCDHISFAIEQGDRIALRGGNGSGKSSIIKLILGSAITYTGNLQKGNLEISYVAQDTSFLSGSLKEYALQNSIDESLFKAILRKLAFSRVQLEKNTEDFSDGQKKKVIIAGSLCKPSHLLIWDEPLNFIDVISRMQIEELLLAYTPTILFVEHDSRFCESIATKTVNI